MNKTQIVTCTSNELDIKPGQVWIRRDGGKARIYATDGMGFSSIHGASKVKEGWRSMSWDASGNFYPIETDYDLIRLYDWREELAPIWAVLQPKYAHLARDHSGIWWCYEKKPYLGGSGYTVAGGQFERLDRTLILPTPDCDWTETLTMRPGE